MYTVATASAILLSFVRIILYYTYLPTYFIIIIILLLSYYLFLSLWRTIYNSVSLAPALITAAAWAAAAIITAVGIRPSLNYYHYCYYYCYYCYYCPQFLCRIRCGAITENHFWRFIYAGFSAVITRRRQPLTPHCHNAIALYILFHYTIITTTTYRVWVLLVFFFNYL